MEKINENVELEFNQKKINHIFHYTKSFDVLLKIIRNGFAPSYCDEKINDTQYYIPMVSFCNIPIKDVDLYMRYGKYGIGMTLEWALKNSISPVVYIHETTPFVNFHQKLTRMHLDDMLFELFNNKTFESVENTINDDFDFSKYDKRSKEIADIAITTIQFFKNWKTIYKNKVIVTYQEREWRYIPNLNEEKRLITKDDEAFKELSIKDLKPKPHLPQYSLKIDSISDLKYLVIKNDEQRKVVMKLLVRTFTYEKVKDSILSGKFLILTEDQIKNDF
jgi:hypothetical protein